MALAVSPTTALVARIDRAELAESLLRAFRSEIAGYSRLPEAVVRGQVLEVIRQNVDLCLDWVAGGAPPDSSRFDAFRQSAKNRAGEGVPLEDLLHAYRMGGTAVWRVLVAEATPEERDGLPQVAELVMNYLDQISGLVATAYLDEREQLVSEQERNVRALLDAVLEGTTLDRAHRETAAQLGFATADRMTTFALAIPGEGPAEHARAAAGLRSVRALALTEGDRVVGLATDGSVVASTLPSGAVAVRDLDVDTDQLASSVADVRLAIELAVRNGETGVLNLPDLALDLLLARSPRIADELRTRVLGPLGGQSRGDLRRTVATYVALGRDRHSTAARLHIHPNTLDHRLKRTRELTGLNLDDPEDLATLVLALREPF